MPRPPCTRSFLLPLIVLVAGRIPSANAELGGSASCAGGPDQNLQTETIAYSSDDAQLTGYLAFDESQTGKRPGVLVVHEWWGHNEYARERARRLAQVGYTAMALDMYGDGKVADHPKDAQAFSQEAWSSIPQMEARFRAAQSILESHSTTDSTRTAAIGYCFGGAIVLHMARVGADLKGVASFHGSLGPRVPAKPVVTRASVLVLHGAADLFVSADQVAGFKKEMDDAGIDYKVVEYAGALHSFTNPGATEIGEKFQLPLGAH